MSVKTKFGKGGLEAASAMPGKRQVAKVGGRLGARGGAGGVRGFRATPTRAKVRAAKGSAKAGRRAVGSNAYVYALMHDESLKRQLDEAYRSMVKAYDRISSQDDLANSLLEDRRTRRHLARATGSLRGAADTLRSAKTRRRRRGARTLVVVGLAGAVAAVALNEDLRNKLMGAVSGESSQPAASDGGGGNGVVPSAAVENAPPTTTSS